MFTRFEPFAGRCEPGKSIASCILPLSHLEFTVNAFSKSLETDFVAACLKTTVLTAAIQTVENFCCNRVSEDVRDGFRRGLSETTVLNAAIQTVESSRLKRYVIRRLEKRHDSATGRKGE
jgi:hypothetical protein